MTNRESNIEIVKYHADFIYAILFANDGVTHKEKQQKLLSIWPSSACYDAHQKYYRGLSNKLKNFIMIYGVFDYLFQDMDEGLELSPYNIISLVFYDPMWTTPKIIDTLKKNYEKDDKKSIIDFNRAAIQFTRQAKAIVPQLIKMIEVAPPMDAKWYFRVNHSYMDLRTRKNFKKKIIGNIIHFQHLNIFSVNPAISYIDQYKKPVFMFKLKADPRLKIFFEGAATENKIDSYVWIAPFKAKITGCYYVDNTLDIAIGDSGLIVFEMELVPEIN